MNRKKFEGLYLFSDVDGTLASTENHIPAKNCNAIQHFVEEGGTFGIATGRYLGDLEVLEDLPINGFGFLNNGAGFYDFNRKKLISSRPLPPDLMKYYLPIFQNNKDYGLLLVNDEGYITVNLDENPRPILDSRYVIKPLEEISAPFYKIMFVLEGNRIQELMKQLKKLDIPGVDYVQTGERTLEVVPHKASKGAAFALWREEFSIEKEHTFFIGDSFNDISFLQEVGLSAVVSHAPDEVKSHADYVSCDFESAAVADFIDYIQEKKFLTDQ